VTKRPIDIPTVFKRLRKAVEPFPRAALFELADEGHDTTFEQLVACILSIRTRDEALLPMARALFRRARTPDQMLELSEAELDQLIRASTFHERKAGQILEIARQARDRHGGALPCDPEVLMSFHGVGPKCANLVLGIACDRPFIGVDVHVHRVTNRWGYVEASSPERTMQALEAKLPERYWVEINALLVPFGKHICTGRRPRCSSCPVVDMCRQVGVEEHR
jgi:endonuclease-3